MSSASPGVSHRKCTRRPGRKAPTLRPESNTSVTAGVRVVMIGRPTYTEYAGLEIRVDLDVALRPRKTAMLVLNCTGAYGGKPFFRLSRVVGAMH